MPGRSGSVAWSLYDGYLLHGECQSDQRHLGYDIPPPPYPLQQPILEHPRIRVRQRPVGPEQSPELDSSQPLQMLPEHGEDALAHGAARGEWLTAWRDGTR